MQTPEQKVNKVRRTIDWAHRNGFQVVPEYTFAEREGECSLYCTVLFQHPDPEFWAKHDAFLRKWDEREAKVSNFFKKLCFWRSASGAQ